jgi:hypothetical protein
MRVVLNVIVAACPNSRRRQCGCFREKNPVWKISGTTHIYSVQYDILAPTI